MLVKNTNLEEMKLLIDNLKQHISQMKEIAVEICTSLATDKSKKVVSEKFKSTGEQTMSRNQVPTEINERENKTESGRCIN